MQNRQFNRYFPAVRSLKWFLMILILLAPVFLGMVHPLPASADTDGTETPLKPTTQIYIPSVLLGSATAPTPDWLTYLNAYRAMAYLPPLTENSAWSTGGEAHSRYTVKNDILMHTEEAGNQWFTQAGMEAAQAGNLMASYNQNASDFHAIDSWMQAPFHAIGILDPALLQVGFGSYREADGGIQMGATLDVLRGLGQIPMGLVYPIMWPGNGTTVPLTKFTSEGPDPLTSCPGYATPSGLPILLQIGPGGSRPAVTGASLSQGGNVVEVCVFTGSTYSNPDRNAQEVGRAILNERDAIVLIPRTPLTPGVSYSVSITANGRAYNWSFSVSASPVD